MAVAESPRDLAGRSASVAQPVTRDAAAAPERSAPSRVAGSPAVGAGLAARGMDPGTIHVPEINTAMVARGDNLWRISRRLYGQGTRYTVIYDANQGQIRNPDRIYPGQLFVVPAEKAAEIR
jgi:nucleoid-associated protein YgaU